MRRARFFLSASALLCSGLAVSHAADVAPPTRDARAVMVTAQSELDYLKASRLPVSVDMKQASAHQILDTVAEAAGIRVAYQGQFDARAFDVSFSRVPLKDLLTKLAAKLGVSYRVEGPTALTVIVEHAN